MHTSWQLSMQIGIRIGDGANASLMHIIPSFLKSQTRFGEQMMIAFM